VDLPGCLEGRGQVQPVHLSLPFPEYLVQRLWRGDLSCRLAGRPMGPNIHMPGSRSNRP